MSTSIDQRVVEMRFDNKQFESNVSSTMSTLEKLKQKLNLKGASKGLENINSAAKSVNMTGLGGAVETVTAKFSALQVMGVTALANITNSAINAGKNIVKSLTIDPIMSGFSEYETKMGSIQTILANTEHQGTTMDQVTSALDELNHYADKTIYNFQEMTRNIGTFTAAGVDLDTSVRSIQGIANLAAVSGSTSQQASTAMYQLSQALATGTVKLMDWNSVVNAGMGGKVFQNALIRTAAMMDGAADSVEAWQAENIDAFGSFRDSLTQGEWLTSEVLTRTLEQFTMAAEEGSKEWEAFKQSLMQSGYTDKQAEEILKMANTATDAATKVKTFTQLMDTLRESAQSGWAQTWELIVGDFEEAKEFFTGLSDMFGGMLGASADRRNGLLGDALGSNWDKMVSKINEAGVETQALEEKIRELAGDDNIDALIEKYGSIPKIFKEGALSTDILKKAIDGLTGGSTETKSAFDFSSMAEKVAGNRFTYSMGGLGKAGEEVKQIQQALAELGYEISPNGEYGKATYQAVMAFQKAEGIKIDGIVGEETIAALSKATGKTVELAGDVDGLSESCEDFVNNLGKASGRELILESIMNIIKAIHRPLSAVGEAFRKVFSLSPEGLYTGLEKINKFTSKLVPKGILDETTWAGLTEKINALGIETDDFTKKLTEVLGDNGVDVASLQNEYGSLAKAFEAGAISVDHIKQALLGFSGVTESLLLGGEKVDKIRRSFEGLFAVIEIIGIILSGPIKMAFQLITDICEHFGLGILDVTANVGDSIVAFRDFLKGIYDFSGIVKVVMPYVEKFASAIAKGFEAFKGTQQFQSLIAFFSGAADSFKAWIEALKTSENLPQDIITGLANGLMAGATVVWNAAVALAQSIITSICEALGIHSPSTVMTGVGENTAAGLANGLQNGLSKIGAAISGIGAKIIEGFGDAMDGVRKFMGKIDFGSIFAVGVGAGMIFVVKTIGNALDTLASPLEGFGSMMEDVGKGTGKFLIGLGANLKAGAWEKRGKALLSFAAAIGILAASLWVLASIEDTGKLMTAVGAIAVLAGVLTLLMFGLSKLGAITGGGGIKGAIQALNFGGLAVALVGLGIVLGIMALVVKQLKGLNPAEAATAFIGLAIMLGAIAGVFAVFGKFVKGKSAKNIGKLGGMLIALGVSLLLMVAVMKLVSKLKPKEIAVGVEFLVAFLAFVGSLAWIYQIGGRGFNKLGGMMLKISLALLIMVAVVKLAGGLSASDMEKGLVFAGAFLAFVAILVKICTIPGSDIANLGGTLAGIAGAMLMLAVVGKLIASMTFGDMAKAAIGILGLTLIIRMLVGIVKTAGTDVPKLAITLLAMSVAIGILAGVAIMLSLLEWGGLIKGLVAVGALSLFVTAMIRATRGAVDCKSNLIVMAVVIGLLAASVAALSMIDGGKLAGATACMASLMAMFALMTYTAKYATGSMGALIVITAALVIIAGIFVILSALDVAPAIGTAAALSMLLLALSASLVILNGVKTFSTAAIGALAGVAIVLVLVGAVIGYLEKYDIAPSVETATALSTLILAMSAACLILAAVGAFGPAAIAGAVTLAQVVGGLGALMIAIGAFMELCPNAEKFATDGIRLLETITRGIGSVLANFVVGLTDGLPAMAENLTTFMNNLQGFIDGISNLDESFPAKADALVKAVTTLVGAEVWGTLSSFLQDKLGVDNPMEQLAANFTKFGEAMSAFATTTAGITPETITPVVDAATKLMGLKPAGDGLFGKDGIDDFGADLEKFGTSLSTFLSGLPDLDPEVVKTLVEMVEDISGIEVPDDGMLGRDGIDNFGTDIAKFGEKLAAFAGHISGISIDTVILGSLMTAATEIANFKIPDDGLFGGDGIDNFGQDIALFGMYLQSYATTCASIDTAAINRAGTATNKIISTITSMVGLDTSGIASFKSAVTELASVDLSNIASSFASAAESMKNAGANIIDNIMTGMNSSSTSLTVAMSNIVTTMKADLTAKNGEFNSAGVELMTGLANGIKNAAGSVERAVSSITTSASNKARNGYQGMYQAGKYLGQGLVNGLNAMLETIKATGEAIGEAAANATDIGAGNNSPSKKTTQSGIWLGEGLVNGMNSMGRAVFNAGYNMGDNAADAITSTVSRISDAINSDIDAQPTIRPVLDLSDVRAGAGSIGSLLNANPAIMSNIGAISTMMHNRRQNGVNDDVVSAIGKLRRDLANMPRESYNINGVTYDDGSNIRGFAEAVVRQARIEGRV